MGIVLENNSQKLLILNVYLPYYSNENYDEYLHYVGKITAIVEDHDHNDIMIIGDFNADINSPFFREWDDLRETADLLFIDVEKLPAGSYTHINSGCLSKSWVDHALVTSTVNRCIDHVEIVYDDFNSDHLPLCMSLKFQMLPTQIDSPEPEMRIKWDFEDDVKASLFFQALTDKINSDPSQFLCHDMHCHIDSHGRILNAMWCNFVKIVSVEAKRIFGLVTTRGRVIPGWNDLVRDHYSASREAFLAWRRDGSPRHGASADHMRISRARFKLALRQCKASENEARARALASKFRAKNMKSFWSDIKSLNKKRPKLPTTVDGVSGDLNICKLWQGKFRSILNSINDEPCAAELNTRLQNMVDTQVVLTTRNEISNIAHKLGSGKAPGTDNIPIEFFKSATPAILTWLSDFFNSLLIHCYIPESITEVVLCPLLKSSLKDPCSSSNYRPIAHATTMSKIFENIILNRLEGFLSTTDYQFGFKKGHGTDVGIFVLKDLINFYRQLNTPTFLCFLDIKSCFDLISYKKLFCILCDKGAPKYVIMRCFLTGKTDRPS